MADIVIRGMEMPKTKEVYVECRIWGDGTVYERLGPGLAWNLEQIGTAIPLPEGYGRLIDADLCSTMSSINSSKAISQVDMRTAM